MRQSNMDTLEIKTLFSLSGCHREHGLAAEGEIPWQKNTAGYV
jgi:hypothetical protein